MTPKEWLEFKVTRSNRKFILICPYDHMVDRVTDSTLLPVCHIHEDKIYECIAFKHVRDVRKWLLNNEPIKK